MNNPRDTKLIADILRYRAELLKQKQTNQWADRATTDGRTWEQVRMLFAIADEIEEGTFFNVPVRFKDFRAAHQDTCGCNLCHNSDEHDLSGVGWAGIQIEGPDPVPSE